MNINNNLDIINEKKILTPIELKKICPIDSLTIKNINKNRNIISNIINKIDNRFLIICGPCSLHDYKSSIEYGLKLINLYKKVNKHIYLVMRTYIEKPRTSIGWKGIVNDPYINNTYDINHGLKISRKILVDLVKINIPISTEILNPLIFKYIDDLFSWVSIGARTSESQIHREIISSLNIPTGFKNNTDGTIDTAINSIKSSILKHSFISINNYGLLSILESQGNKNLHIVLRGGKNKPNYYIKNIIEYKKNLKKNKIIDSIIIDCSHDNSKKIYKSQINISKYVIKNKFLNNLSSIIGIMLESNLKEGNQNILNTKKIKYGISITDPCINWKDTEYIINYIFKKISKESK